METDTTTTNPSSCSPKSQKSHSIDAILSGGRVTRFSDFLNLIWWNLYGIWWRKCLNLVTSLGGGNPEDSTKSNTAAKMAAEKLINNNFPPGKLKTK